MTFVYFKKAYDSVDRDTLIKVQEEFGIDDKTRSLIQEILTNTRSPVKHLGDQSEPFEIKTSIRQGDSLSQILFNWVLHKVIYEGMEEKLSQHSTPNGIKLGHKKTGLKFECLTYADYIFFFAETLGIEIKQKSRRKSRKTQGQIYFEKTEYINAKDPNWTMRNKYGENKRGNKFKYLDEIQTPNVNEKAANEEHARRIELAFRLWQETYKSKSLSYQARFRHYSTMVKPACLYAAETTARKGLLEIEKKERTVLRKILRHKKVPADEFTFHLRSNKELHKTFEKISTAIK